jgi:hypothetical protein
LPVNTRRQNNAILGVNPHPLQHAT